MGMVGNFLYGVGNRIGDYLDDRLNVGDLRDGGLDFLEEEYPELYGRLIDGYSILAEDPIGGLRNLYQEMEGEIPLLLLNPAGYLEKRVRENSLNDPQALALYEWDKDALREVYDEWHQEKNISHVLADTIERDRTDLLYSLGQLYLRFFMHGKDDVKDTLQQNPRLRGREPTSDFYGRFKDILGRYVGPFSDVIVELIEDRPKEVYRDQIRRLYKPAGRTLDILERISDYSVFASNAIMPLFPDEDDIRNKGVLKYVLRSLSTPLWVFGEGLDILPIYIMVADWALPNSFRSYAEAKVRGTLTEDVSTQDAETTNETGGVPNLEGFLPFLRQLGLAGEGGGLDLERGMDVLNQLGISPNDLTRVFGNQTASA